VVLGESAPDFAMKVPQQVGSANAEQIATHEPCEAVRMRNKILDIDPG
jgi:hypothetical protein